MSLALFNAKVALFKAKFGMSNRFIAGNVGVIVCLMSILAMPS
jgi:hypothetical protein